MAEENEKEINDGSLLELLELYMDIVTKQDTVIFHMSNVIARQARELQHIKTLHGFLDYPGKADSEMEAAEAALKDYQKSKEIE